MFLTPDDDDMLDLLDTDVEMPATPVLSLSQVARGMTVLVPTTVYKTEDSHSGVMGILFPSGEFLGKASSNVGNTIPTEDEWHQSIELTTVWDGASPQPESEIPIGFQDEAQSQPIFAEHSKGLLLGDYAQKRPGHMRRVFTFPTATKPTEGRSSKARLDRRERPSTWGDIYNQMQSKAQRDAEIAEGGYFAA